MNFIHFYNSCPRNCDHNILLIMTGNIHKESCHKLLLILVREKGLKHNQSFRNLGRKYESGSQKRVRKEREIKSKEVESKCKKISQFFPNVNQQLADPPSIQSLTNDSQAEEVLNLECTAEQTFDIALDTESEIKSVNDVNESMQTSTNVTENNSDDPDLLKNIDDDFRLYILENGLNEKTNISFTNSKRTYDDGINRYLLKKDIPTEF